MTLDATLIAAFIWAECFDCAGLRWLRRDAPLAAYTIFVAIMTLFALRLFTLVVVA